MGALLEPALEAPKPQALADLRELELARAGQLTLGLLGRQNARTLKAIERDLAELDAAIVRLVAGDEGLARRAAILCSIPGISAVSAAAILAWMPELGALQPGPVASLAGVAPSPLSLGPMARPWRPRQSGRWKGAAKIGGGRAELRRALYMPALSAVRCNPDLKAVYDRLRAAGKPAKVALTAAMRKLLILANALIRDDREWTPTRP